MVYKLKIIFTKEPQDINNYELPDYEYLYKTDKLDIKPGDMVKSKRYYTPIQIISIEKKDVYPYSCALLEIDEILTSKNSKTMSKKIMNEMSGLMDGIMKSMVPEIDNKLRLSQQGICVPTTDGMVASFDASGERVESPAITTFKVPVYIAQKPADQVVIGDVLKLSTNSYARVIEPYNPVTGVIKCITFNSGANHSFKPAFNTMTGQKSVRCAFNMFGNLNSMNIPPMILAYAQEDGAENMSFEDIFMMSMITSAQTSNGPMASMINNPIMISMLLGKSGNNEESSLMKNMFLMQMFQGNMPNQTMTTNAWNPFSNMFGSNPQPTTAETSPEPKPKSMEDMSIEELEEMLVAKKHKQEETARKAELIRQIKEAEETGK